jgi:hypothetical protein
MSVQIEDRVKRRRDKHATQLRPRLLTINESCRYAAVGRSKFYEDLLPRVKTVRLGRRNLIELESLDRLIDELIAEG